MTPTPTPHREASPTGLKPPVAVIDIGTTSIRMAVAQFDEAGHCEVLESLRQDLNLGQDTFTRGSISKTSIEACVKALKGFRRVLHDYQIEDASQIRAVATSAVREASNREAFLDRVYIGAGIQVEPADEAEVSHLTYLGIEPHLRDKAALRKGAVLVLEVGGGSTELLLLNKGRLTFSHTYRLGSYRMRQMLDSYGAPVTQRRAIMENQILRALDQIRHDQPIDKVHTLMILGGDARLAASCIQPDADPRQPVRLSLNALSRFAEEILALSIDDLVLKFRMSYPAAETLGPALLAYVIMARGLGIKEVLVSPATMRDGLLAEWTTAGTWNELFREQMIRSALDLGRRYRFHEAHGTHVANLARDLFRGLQEEHQLGSKYELLLYITALLHEIGEFIGIRSHHKHSMYIIEHSELFGLSGNDLRLVAVTARYHRRAAPKTSHEEYARLDREDRIVVSKLASILRVADALDRSHHQRVKHIQARVDDGIFRIEVPQLDDLSLERMALRQKGGLFETVYGLDVELRTCKRT